MKNIRWGIIGCGNVTELKSGPAFQKVPGSELVSVMRRNAALAADYAQRHGVARWYADASALINDPEVNAVYIATPPDTHALYAIQTMKAGKPVYVEKPMANSYEECISMIEACKAADVPLFVAYYRRALPGFNKFLMIESPDDFSSQIYNDSELEVVSSAKGFDDVMVKGSTKGNALHALAKHMGIPDSHVFAIGDNDNDYSMFDKPFNGIAMGNATPILFDVAKYVTSSCEEDGFAKACHDFIIPLARSMS